MLDTRRTALAAIFLILPALSFAQEPAVPQVPPPATSAEPATAAEPAASAGKPSDGFLAAEGLENWRRDYDVSGFKPGTYNILVRVTDSAGNVSFGGPFNIVVDPASDLPVTRVANPLPFMRAGADVNVVGTCVDDDAVDHVEVRIDEGEWTRAKGADYWSYYLATADLEDGLHRLAARGVDVNGVAGIETSVPFHLDRTKPLHGISSPDFGTLVSGRLSLSGTAFDANGLKAVSYSPDEGVTWTPIKFSLDKSKNTASFSLALDTRKMPDGPSVLWFKSVDGVGSEGLAVFLYFVDNTKPELAILSPLPEESVNGGFNIIGRVHDTVGIESLDWTYGKEAGKVELLPGNPYFSVPFTAPAQGGKAVVRFSAKDITGNVTVLDVPCQVDPRADLPLVRLAYPQAGAVLEQVAAAAGGARDDDGIASVQWRVDGGEPTDIVTDGAFSFEVPALASGKHVLSVRAVDVTGLQGPWTDVPFTFVGFAPRLSLLKAIDPSGESAFLPGISVSTIEGKAVVVGSVEAASPLSELSYSVNGAAPVKLSPPKGTGAVGFTIPLPSTLPYGVLVLRVRAVDSAGKEGLAEAPLYAINYSRPRVGPLLDFAGALDGEIISLKPDAPFIGAFIAPYAGEVLASVRLEPATPLAAAEFDGTLVRVAFRAEGMTGPTKVVATTVRGHRFESERYLFKTDAVPPELTVAKPAFGSWHRSSIALEAVARDGDSVSAVEYSLGGGSWLPLAASAAGYSANVDLTGLSGPVHIEVRATDAAGNATSAATAIMVDAAPPEPQRLLPKAGDPSGGSRLFAVTPGETSWSTAKIELGRNGAYEELPWAPILTFSADASAGPLSLRVTDKAGNVTVANLAEGLAPAPIGPAPAPVADLKRNVAGAPASGPAASWTGADASGSIAWSAPFAPGADDPLLPADSAAVRISGALALAAVFTGISPDPKKPEAFWGYSQGAIDQPLALKASKTAGAWEGSLKAPVRPDGPATIWVRVRDVSSGDLFTRVNLDYDGTAPAIETLAPKGAQPGSFTLVARATDARGIASISWEAGAEKGEFSPVPGTADVARDFSFPQKGGQLTIVLKAMDSSGNRSQSSVAVAYDLAADAPRVRFVTPADGSTRGFDGPMIVYAEDDDAIASVSMSLDGKAVGATGPGSLFLLDGGPAAAGKRALALAAVDSQGIPSAKATASFTRIGTPPVVTVRAVQAGKSAAIDFRQGMSAVLDGGASLSGSVMAPNGLASLEYRLDDAAWTKLGPASKPAADGSWPFTVPIPASAPYERLLVSIRAQDGAGGSSSWSGSVYRVSSPPAGPSDDAEGVYVSDPRVGGDGRVLLAPGESLGALWNGREIQTLSLEPPVKFIDISHEAGSIRLSASSEGISGPSVIRVTTVDGDVFNSRPLVVSSDASGPRLSLAGPLPAAWARDILPLEGTVSDPNGVSALEWSLDGGASWTAAPLKPLSPGPGQSFRQDIPLDQPDGASELFVRASDGAGRTTIVSIQYYRDSVAPAAVLNTPGTGDLVNGTILLAGWVEDKGDLASAEFSPDGLSWEPLAFAPMGAGAALPAGKGAPEVDAAGRNAWSRLVDLASLKAGVEAMAFRFRDKAGNSFEYRPLAGDAPAFAVDIEADKPLVQVQIPIENDVMRSDFIVSGMAFDDDGVGAIFWRADGGEWNRVEGANAFFVPFALMETADNEHVFEAYAVDLNGVTGETSTRKYRVSREEPVGNLSSPDVSLTNRGSIELKGNASDANGIKEVWVSFDNGNTYNRAAGTTSWTYKLDTRVLQDGVHSVYVKLLDGYDTPGFAAGLISVDNTAPALELTGPADGDEFIGSFVIGGRASDAVIVERLTVDVTPIGADKPVLSLPIGVAQVFSRTIELGTLPPGWYNVKVTTIDHADNRSYQSRNIVVRESRQAETAEIVFPARGERLSGRFTLDGRIVSEARPDRAQLFLNDQPFATVELNGEGWFSLPVDETKLADGELTFRLEAIGSSGAAIVAEPRTVLYETDGPWVDIESIFTGDFIVGRPYLVGAAGWNMPEDERADKSDKEAWGAYQKLVKERTPVKIEISRDNGRSFMEAKGAAEFKFRLETQEYPNGELRLIVRATFANGETAVRKRIVTLDTKPPVVSIVRPGENGRFNGSIAIEGTASDENGLSNVEVTVRSGDKASYVVPGFIQGSYLDVHMLGATRFELGLGLSFFQDNVKLQVNFGQGFDAQPSWTNLLGIATADTPASELSRFSGYVLGFKLLANLAYLPFGYWFGPDWDFFSMSFAMGASFTYFSQSDELGMLLSPPDGKYMVLSGIVGQWEFAKFEFDTTFMKSVGLYVEGGLIFIPSEASTSLDEFIRINLALGIRVGLF